LAKYPSKIICLTEESVETLYLLGCEKKIVGISAFVERPEIARKSHPVVTTFTHSNTDKILAQDPDLVLGFSDIQKDIAKDLIGQGLNVWISNQRSIAEILNYILQLGAIVGADSEAKLLIKNLENKITSTQALVKGKKRPKVYFEEWDGPIISAIRWVAELIEVCGGEYIFPEKAIGVMAKDRFVESNDVLEKNPDIILMCWCGKKFDDNILKTRAGWERISAIRNNKVFELDPAIFLQPGPAPILAGIDILLDIFHS
jgi:iron complex transport system substrate-binding protein